MRIQEAIRSRVILAEQSFRHQTALQALCAGQAPTSKQAAKAPLAPDSDSAEDVKTWQTSSRYACAAGDGRCAAWYVPDFR